MRRCRIGFYLRDTANVHYFAALRPYLDALAAQGSHELRIVVRTRAPGWEATPDFAGYEHLFVEADDLDSWDLVVTPSFLRPHEHTPGVRAVQIFHGMSDKPFTYERDFSRYEVCLCAGQRQIDRLRLHPPNREARLELVGYPKFDRIPSLPRAFENDRPTVAYCPTWSKGGLSSARVLMGRPAVIDRLVRRYNLIVKPHPNLLNPRRPHYDAGLAEALLALDRSRAVKVVRDGNVMPWFAQADLYVGDISATGYEWLYFDRPMLFLNPRPGGFASTSRIDGATHLWQCGRVCDDVEALPDLVDAALREDRHHEIRERVLHYSVHQPRQGSAADLGIRLIQSLLDDSRGAPSDRGARAS